MMTLFSVIIASSSLFPTPAFIQPEEVKTENVAPSSAESEQQTITQQDQIGNLKLEIERLKHKEEVNQIQSIYYKIMFLRSSLGVQTAQAIAENVYSYSKKYNVDPDLTLAIIRVESYFEKRAISPTGARGLTQCMPLIWSPVCGKNLFDIPTSVNCGLLVLTTYTNRYEGNVKLAILAYNMGPEALDYLRKNRMSVPTKYYKDILRFFRDLKAIQKPFETESDVSADGLITLK